MVVFQSAAVETSSCGKSSVSQAHSDDKIDSSTGTAKCPTDHADHSCAHVNHGCHVGHGVFPVTVAVSLDKANFESLHNSSSARSVPFDYVAFLLRPPISIA